MESGVLTPPRVAAGAVLDTWAAQPWRDGVLVNRLQVHDRLTIQTRHSIYEIVVLAPLSAEVLVRGGAFFPEFTTVRVAGCSLGGSFLKVYGVYVGFRIELVTGTEMIITSPVQTIVVARGDEPPARLM